MGLIAALAVLRAHVLVVEVPGRPLLRLRAEAAVRARGWRLASSPADADLLLVCGTPSGELAEALDRVWSQVPFPRARRAVTAADAVEPALDGAGRALGDDALQRRSAAAAAAAAAERPDPGRGMHEHMAGPGGIPLAGGSEADRDDLEMDVLHLPLGPVLPDWPAGLVVDLVLSGDVVLAAEARLLPAEAADPDVLEAPERRLVLDLDRAATLLRLAGLPGAAARVERAITALLGGAEPDRVLPAVRRLARRLHASATLRWTLAGEGDAAARLVGLLRQDPAPAPVPVLDPEGLAAALVGRGLASVRLRVAAAEPFAREAAGA